MGRREAEVAVSQARQSVLVDEPGISSKEPRIPVSRPSSPPLASSRAWRGASCWCLPRLPSSLSTWSRSMPCPPSALQLHMGAFHQPEDQTPTQSWPRWRVLTRATFIRALAQAQTKQDIGSAAVGRMGPVWAEVAGVKSVFSSLSSMASPSLRLHQPRVRAQRERERHPSAVFGSLLCSALHGAGKHLEPSQENHV